MGAFFKFIRQEGEAEGHGGGEKKRITEGSQQEGVNENRVEFKDEGAMAKKAEGG
ncbi:MAG: hypothetical protein FWD46_09010 [Cystobacterineae bacterium]|nr:hypothetical protein [Cystobacterineae bacterium]